MNELVSLAVLGKAEECADEGASGELAPLLFRDMHEWERPEDVDKGDVWLVPAPRLRRGSKRGSLRSVMGSTEYAWYRYIH